MKKKTKMPWIALSQGRNAPLGWSTEGIESAGIPSSLHAAVGGCFLSGIRCRAEQLAMLLSALDATALLPTTYIVRDAGWYGQLEGLQARIAGGQDSPDTEATMPTDCHWEHGLHVTRAQPLTVTLLQKRPLMLESLVHAALVRSVALRGIRRNHRDPVLGPWLFNQKVHDTLQRRLPSQPSQIGTAKLSPLPPIMPPAST